jgi:hypothetical protein
VGLVRGDSPLLQDARKLINKFWELSKLEKPPYRIAFGEDAKVRAVIVNENFLTFSQAAFAARWTALKTDLEASEEWSQDLKFD